jgi:hypothetical protein
MKKFNYKKGQAISFDLSNSIIIFVIFIVIVIGSFFLLQSFDQGRSIDFELEYVFANFENNLKFDAILNPGLEPGRDFLINYRVNKTKLDAFATEFVSTDTSIDSYVIGSIGDAHGIGLDESGYDTCLYFIDINGQKLKMGVDDDVAIGMLKIGTPDVTSCHEEIFGNDNPCDGYKSALSLFKPVLYYDDEDPNENRIISMNLVLCKI